jgi:hypothetical protein
MADWKGREQRHAPRVDVLRRVRGQFVAIDVEIVVHNLSRTGFGVVSRAPFPPGETLDFELAGPHGIPVRVTARSMRTEPVRGSRDLHFSGFMFVPGRLTGTVPLAQVDKLIAAISPAPALL